jgi:hypothetical protein
MRPLRRQDRPGPVLARCAEILDQVDQALSEERYADMAALLRESEAKLGSLVVMLGPDVDRPEAGAYAGLRTEREKLVTLLRRTGEILDSCRERRALGLQSLRLLKTEKRFEEGDRPESGRWLNGTC